MEDDYSSNVHAGLEKSVRFLGCPLWRGFVVRDSLGIRPGQDFLSVLKRCRFRGCPLEGGSTVVYYHRIGKVKSNILRLRPT